MPTKKVNRMKASKRVKKVKIKVRAEDKVMSSGKKKLADKKKSTAHKAIRVRQAAARPEAGRRSAIAIKAVKNPRGYSGHTRNVNNFANDSGQRDALSVGGAGGKKSAAKISRSDLEYFRQLLLDKRREILGDVGSMENEAFRDQDNHSSSPMHMADVGTDNFEQEFTLGLLQSERELLKEIQEALNRIDNGSFGICIATGKPIGLARLKAKPWAKYCIEYARMIENNTLPHNSGANSVG
ncbi:MAG: TraR/DksA family transcriptional regulator [Phycisphaerae bacterium]